MKLLHHIHHNLSKRRNNISDCEGLIDSPGHYDIVSQQVMDGVAVTRLAYQVDIADYK